MLIMVVVVVVVAVVEYCVGECQGRSWYWDLWLLEVFLSGMGAWGWTQSVWVCLWDAW